MKSDEPSKIKNGHAPPTKLPAPLVTTLPEAHPLAGVIGGFADDPLWDEFLEQMEQSRRALDHTLEVVE